MQITRAKATALLNKGEMQLYDDSRHNPIRGFTVKQLEARITRARALRDRSRDLVRRQKLSSRERTGSKRGTSGTANQRSADKAEILADILKRFETRLKDAKKEEKAAAKQPQASAGRSAAASKKSGRKADRRSARSAVKKAAKTVAPKKAAGGAVKKAAKKSTGKAAKTTAKKAARKAARSTAKKAAKKTAKKTAKKAGRVTPGQALRSTRKVLKAKQEQARQPPAWPDPTGHGGQVDSDGFQSGEAARKAEDLHAAESRLPAIQGSIGTRDRLNQGKRDKRGGGEG